MFEKFIDWAMNVAIGTAMIAVILVAYLGIPALILYALIHLLAGWL